MGLPDAARRAAGYRCWRSVSDLYRPHPRPRTFAKTLLSVRRNIEAAASDYEQKADTGDLHLIAAAATVADCVTKDEMVRVYDQRMASKAGPGRAIYDQIKLLPVGGPSAHFVTNVMYRHWTISCRRPSIPLSR